LSAGFELCRNRFKPDQVAAGCAAVAAFLIAALVLQEAVRKGAASAARPWADDRRSDNPDQIASGAARSAGARRIPRKSKPAPNGALVFAL